MAIKQGLIVNNSDGLPILELTDSLTKYSGEVDIIPQTQPTSETMAYETGTVQCDELLYSKHLGFWCLFTEIYMPSMTEPVSKSIEFPIIRREDGYFSWTYVGNTGNLKAGVHIIYGVY